MYYDKLNNERRALYGFEYAFEDYKGWFNALFQPYNLYPYLNLLRDETRDLLYKETLLKKLVPVFSKHLRISSLVKKIIGFDFIKDRKSGVGFIEDLAKIILEEIESRQSLEGRISSVEKRLQKTKKYFAGLTHKIHKHEQHPVLKDRDSSTDGNLVAVEGILNNLEAVGPYNMALQKSFKHSGINWILSDFPYFSMRPENPLYDGNVLGLRIDEEVEALISDAVPLRSDLGWYPYVRVYGILHNSLSPKFPNIKIVDWLWMQFRLPESFDSIQPLLDIVLNDQQNENNGCKEWLDIEEPFDFFLYLSAVHLAYASQSLEIDSVSKDIKELAHKAVSNISIDLPEPLAQFYGDNRKAT